MRQVGVALLALAGWMSIASAAVAGWEIEQVNFRSLPHGAGMTKRTSTLRVSKGKVRVNDDPTTIIIDYTGDRLALILPARHLYWSGTSDDYIREAAASDPKHHTAPGDSATTPTALKVEVVKTAAMDTIAGNTATKYDVKVDGNVFQELWIASGVHLDADLDVQRLQGFQEKIGQSVKGKNGAVYAALSTNPAYVQLQKTGFPLRTRMFLGANILGREVQRLTPVEIPESEFEIPASFTQTTLGGILDAQHDLAR